MSNTESFETHLCELMGYFYDNSYATRLCERIRRAHDREIAQARDPQRLRGTKPDTFNGAIEALREFRWQHATNDEDAIPYINAVKEMHDREIRDVSQQQYERGFRDGTQQEYHRGYEDGRHSMDAEHRAVAMRLRALPLDGGSHENLSQIARAVYHNDFGWAANDCAALRDELVRLMGGVSQPSAADVAKELMDTIIEEGNRRLESDGNLSKSPKTINLDELTTALNHGKAEMPSITEVSDENVHVGGLRCDDGCMGDVSNGEDTGRAHDSPSNRDRNHMAVHECVDTVIGDSDDTCCCAGGGACNANDGDCTGEQKEVSDGGTADDSGADFRGGDGGGDLHLAGVTYDVLDNERRKAIAELRKCDGGYTLEWDNIYEIFDALGVEYVGMAMAEVYENFRDRLIHLLGGDQTSGIDVLRAMDAESDVDGTCPNDVPTSSITDELREWARTEVVSVLRAKINCFADRIDEQFGRICVQQEAVLQHTIDEMVEERDELADNRDIWRGKAMQLTDVVDRYVGRCDDLLDLLRDAADDFKNASYGWNYAVIVGENITMETERNRLAKERDELRRKVDELEKFDADTSLAAFGDDNDELRRLLSRAAKLLEIAEHDRDTNYAYWMDCKDKVVHANITIDELQAKLDAITAALNG